MQSLDHGELVGRSWYFTPCVRHLGGEAMSPVRACEFAAETVRARCEAS
ncbi:hypothetical protein [Streptomyces sp. NRRL F-2799]|nr:hypothetical protein [Streptomyces sp. NRRL F-2799]